MTAAHAVLSAKASAFTAASPTGTASFRVDPQDIYFGNNLDHALMAPLTGLPPDAATGVNAMELAGVRKATAWLVGRPAFFHHAIGGQRVVVTVRQVDAVVAVPMPSGTLEYFSGLIVIDGVTNDGDSGTLLYDAERMAVGTLLGRMGDFSYFASLYDACVALGLTPLFREGI